MLIGQLIRIINNFEKKKKGKHQYGYTARCQTIIATDNSPMKLRLN
jgi:hypothetical protein